MLHPIWLGLFSPLVGFLILLIGGRWINRRAAGIIASVAMLIAFVVFASLLYVQVAQDTAPATHILYKWISLPGIKADIALHLDHLSLLMALIITGVGFLIHVYSIGYMDHEADFVRYFACLNFFVFAMLILVLSSSLLLLFVGWEGVGLASYLLIGFDYHRPSAANAATKAFVVNRIGDVGLLLAILLVFQIFGTSDMVEIIRRAPLEFTVGAPLVVLLTILIFWGATGKSAQLPLHVWLPDAMEGPTPVSALIHAATMVTAGVYIIVRLHEFFLLAPLTMQLVGYVGGATALFAALCATAQTDLKRVLAYSTISQLGLMFLACGAGAFYAAMFHLTAHAFVKAQLFLSAGNVLHMTGGVTDMRKMGGLAKQLGVTQVLFLIGVLAMGGVPPLSIFFSKDLILEEEYLSGHVFLFYMGLAVTLLTAFYLMRAYCMTFLGKSNFDAKMLHFVKEAPRVMLIPVSILAFLSITGGLLGFSLRGQPPLEKFLTEQDPSFISHAFSNGFHINWEMWMSISAALLGVISAAVLYTKYSDKLGPTIALFNKAFYVDEIYEYLFVIPLKSISRFIVGQLEPVVFDGSIRALSRGTENTARQLQKFQSGQIRSYLSWLLLGAVALIVYLIY
ncbi:MAG: NADH-quinone oxidoreductase subunit L [Parachlamydiaceae bacterium]|nr:NADH-quinone oxidoreductase subunit L [Parachlamydiaceae bacterium]